MYFSKDKDINQLVRELLQLGWTYVKGRHYKLYPPNGSSMLVVPSTPSDRRAFLNFRNDVRQRLCARVEGASRGRKELTS